METIMKHVDFTYCTKCKYFDTAEDQEPCNECLNNPVNEYSHKPVNYKEKVSK